MNFTFGSAYFLVLLLLIPCFIWCKQFHKIYYFSKLSWITKQSSFLSLEAWFKIVLFTLMVFALAKPFIYDSKNSKHKKGRDLILALDASGSMAQSGFNIKERFKNKFEINIELASDFIQNRFDDNMGVVIFGTFAYTASPLTYDLKSLSYLMSMSNVGIAGESTAMGDAIMQSIDTLSFGEAKNRAIILITDGYHNAGKYSPKMAVEKAKALGIKIYTIGIGKKSDYDFALLKQISKETKAKSYSAINSESLTKIYKEINTFEPSPIRSENYLRQVLLVIYPLLAVFIALLLWVFFILWKRRENR